MSKHSNGRDDESTDIRARLIGLGERSVRKSYYPELVQRHEELERFHNLLEHITDAIFLVDMRKGTVVDAVGNIPGIVGRRKDQCIGANISDMISSEGEYPLRRILESLGEDASPKTMCGWFDFAAGKGVPVEITAHIDTFGGVSYAVFVARDITDRINAERALKASEERYRLVADYNYDWEMWVGPDGRLLYISPSCKRISGYGKEIFLKDRAFFEQLIHREDLEAWKSLMAEAAVAEVEQFDFRIFNHDGRMAWVSQVTKQVTGDDGKPMGLRISLRDITARKVMEKQLQYQALHDPLTGLANRTLCLDRISQAMGRAKRRSEYSFGVVFVDLDRFKVVNDSLGHSAGDKLLVEFSQRLLTCVRNLDTVSRFGGDEFVILLEELSGPSEALRIIKRVREEVGGPFIINGHEIQSSASFGLLLSPSDFHEPERLLQNANIAMHKAKEAGRNRIKVFNAKMLDQAVQTMTLENELRRAVANDEFYVVYQPQVSLFSGRLSGFEALVRWDHPRLGVMAPGRFIPLAEETGIILDIGRIVLQKACKTMSSWRESLPNARDVVLSVNLSAKQFNQPDLVQMVTRILDVAGLPAECLKLEITESAIMDNPEDTVMKLARLKSRGIGVSIDDFGTGYSSMSYLQRFPLNYLKIDQNFIQNLELFPENLAIVKAIINLGHSLGLKTIAEGVERSSHVRILSSLKCEFAQGFFFSGPLSTKEAENLIIGCDVLEKDKAIGK